MPTPSQDEIAAAAAYEELHVPALFGQWAGRMAEAAQIGAGQRVLDVACGTGILAREAAARVGDDGSVTGVDASPGMLAVARRLAPTVDWRLGFADSLPFPESAFDAVVSQFGLMFFPDRAAALREMLRVLRPGGRLAVAVWDALEKSPAWPLEVELLDRIGGRPAGDALRAPFVMGDPVKLEDLLRGAGGDAIRIQTQRGTARFPSIRAMVEADLRGWLPVMGVVLDEDRIERILTEAENALSAYVTDEGTVEFPAPAHIASARKP